MVRASTLLITLAAAGLSAGSAMAGNPIIPNRGVNDPHIRIFGDKAYLYATHDKSATNDSFIMEDWWVWSSRDLVNWELESVLDPASTYIGEGFQSAWATDAAEKDGRYYWYFSEANRQTGVVVGSSPTGPWSDPLGGPLLSSGMTPTHEYDPGILKDSDGNHYIVFGVWDYHIARLADDMVSLAEKPRLIEIEGAVGPYTFSTEGPFAGKRTDDKPFLHERGGRYYLSWGAFYAMADNPYGPYRYVDTVMKKESFEPGLESPTWPHGFLQGRHGSFFDWHNQSYFAYCDISQTGNRFFRDTFISYVHYRDDGTISPIRVERIGVGEYDPDAGPVEAENYFAARGISKREHAQASGGFALGLFKGRVAELSYPNMHSLHSKTTVRLFVSTQEEGDVSIEILSSDGEGRPTETLSEIRESLRTGIGYQPITIEGIDFSISVGLHLRIASSASGILLDRVEWV